MKLRLKGQKNVYEEIAEQYKNYILLGVLKEDERLPSCRELAIELGINPNTVEKAYSLLEADRLVIKVPKKGVYVSKVHNDENRIVSELEKQIVAFKKIGVSFEEVMAAVNKVYEGALE